MGAEAESTEIRSSVSNEFFRFKDSLAQVQHFRYKARMDYPTHSHSVTSIVICTQGKVESVQTGSREVLHVGDVVITNRDTPHSSRYFLEESISEGITLDLEHTALLSILRSSTAPLKFNPENSMFLGRIRSHKIFRMAQMIASETSRRSPGFDLIIASIAEQIVIETLRSWPRSLIVPIRQKSKPRLARWEYIRTIEMMNELKYSSFSIPALSRALGLTQQRFSQEFGNAGYMSPLHQFHLLTAERAAISLTQSNVSVKEVAFNMGFRSVSHFASFFKKIVGISPGEYRKRADSEAGLPGDVNSIG